MTEIQKKAAPDRVDDLQQDEIPTRVEERSDTNIPLRLIMRLRAHSGEVIPAILTNLSASGLLGVVDTRFSSLLPPPLGTRFSAEFFLDEVEIRNIEVKVARIEKHSQYEIALGCTFVNLPTDERLALRAKVAASLATPRRRKS
jgi:hypothetical protein